MSDGFMCFASILYIACNNIRVSDNRKNDYLLLTLEIYENNIKYPCNAII